MAVAFAETVVEVEKVILPLGFKIEKADYFDRIPLSSGNFKTDEGELKIVIVRNGKLD
jgi:hypothetical protein